MTAIRWMISILHGNAWLMGKVRFIDLMVKQTTDKKLNSNKFVTLNEAVQDFLQIASVLRITCFVQTC